MPQLIAAKPRIVQYKVNDVVPLFNAEQNLGRQVKLTRGKYAGQVGKIISIVTANRQVSRSGTQSRFVFYAVELATVILDAVTWDDFLWVNK